MALLDTMQQALEPYFDLDFLDPLSAPRKKKDGNYYTTYIAELQPSLMTLVPDSGSVILKEISPAQADIYEKISSIWNPYIETVFGVIYQNGQNLAVNEFIPKMKGTSKSCVPSGRTGLWMRSMNSCFPEA